MGEYDVIERMNMVRDAIADAKDTITKVTEPGRELACALTKLDEARLWALESLSSQATRLPIKE